jgi:hypothetical protein
MSTPEGLVKQKIKKLLNKYGAYSHMPVSNGMGAPSLDYICCINGMYLGIEAKTRGKKPSPRQVKTMASISKAGGMAIWVDEDRLESLEKLLQKLSAMEAVLRDTGKPTT